MRRVVGLDAATGDTRWERVIDLTECGGDLLGTAYKDGLLLIYGYYSNHDVLTHKAGALAWRRVTVLSAEDGADVWSRPLNYRRRPLIIGDTLIIEPRACDLRTGAVKSRIHPLTREESVWEFARPGHSCGIASAAPHMFFLRANCLWHYDLDRDQGVMPYYGVRPGCWINVIPANGLVLAPEASAGCTCSFPIQSTVVLQPRPANELKAWSIFAEHGAGMPVRRLAINFGAPGERRDAEGKMWFGYPHPPYWNSYGDSTIDFDLHEESLVTDPFFQRDVEGVDVKGTPNPWLYASGCKGLTSCELPLLEKGQGPAQYTVRMYFAETEHTHPGRRVFSIKLQGETVLDNFDIIREAGAANTAVMKEFKGILVETGLRVEFVCDTPAPDPSQAPLINAMEVTREDAAMASLRR